jgi:hypothetical protein
MPARAKALKAALRGGLETLVVSLADRAAEDTVTTWQRSDAGTALVSEFTADSAAGQPDSVTFDLASDLDFIPSGPAGREPSEPGPAASATLARSSPDLATRSARAIGEWQDHVMQLVKAENVTKRSVARVVSFDEESLALVLTIGILGYGSVSEVASAVPQRLLTSLFGAGQLRDLGARARLDLRDRISLLFDEEMQRFAAIVDAAGAPDVGAADALREAADYLEVAR